MHPYKPQFIHTLRAGYHDIRFEFCCDIQGMFMVDIFFFRIKQHLHLMKQFLPKIADNREMLIQILPSKPRTSIHLKQMCGVGFTEVDRLCRFWIIPYLK